MTDEPVVLVVEDNEQLADMYVGWLADRYAVVSAYDGRDALALLSDRIDVVLLDRLMAGLSGETVLETIGERGLDCRVALVTAVDPDLDVLGMEFDEYLTKPVRRGDLYHAVERLLSAGSYTEAAREYETLAEKRELLEANLGADRLAKSDEYGELLKALLEATERREDDAGRWGGSDPGAALFRRLSHSVSRSEADE